MQVPLGLDHPYWIEDPNFDLEYHVRHIALPKPGDWRQLCIQVARLHSRPLDRSRPLWEMYVIEGLDSVDGLPKGSFAIMTKIHHAAVDGVTLLEITERRARHDARRAAAGAGEGRGSRRPVPHAVRAHGAGGRQQRRRGRCGFARLMARSLPGAAAGCAAAGPADFELPSIAARAAHPLQRAPTTHRVMEARRFELATAKQIKAAVQGATINDVAITVVGGALRTYLAEKGELPTRAAAGDGAHLHPHAPSRPARPATRSRRWSSPPAPTSPTRGSASPPCRSPPMRPRRPARRSGRRELSQFSEFMPGGLAALAARTATQFQMATRTSR